MTVYSKVGHDSNNRPLALQAVMLLYLDKVQDHAWTIQCSSFLRSMSDILTNKNCAHPKWNHIGRSRLFRQSTYSIPIHSYIFICIYTYIDSTPLPYIYIHTHIYLYIYIDSLYPLQNVGSSDALEAPTSPTPSLS